VARFWRYGAVLAACLADDSRTDRARCVGLRLAINIIVAFLLPAVLGVLLDKKIKEHLFYPGPVIAALAVGGVVMISFLAGIAAELKAARLRWRT